MGVPNSAYSDTLLSTTLGLPAPIIPNVVDSSVSLYALFGTPISSPSAYDIKLRSVGRQLVRTDQTPAVDFAFNLDSSGHAVSMPTGAGGLVQAWWWQVQSVA